MPLDIPQIFPARLIPFSATLAWWTANNPIPKDAEIVIEIASPRKAKIGDGVTPYLSLPYITGGTGTPQTLQDTLNLGNLVNRDTGNVDLISFYDLAAPSSTKKVDIDSDGLFFYTISAGVGTRVMEFDINTGVVGFKVFDATGLNKTVEIKQTGDSFFGNQGGAHVQVDGTSGEVSTKNGVVKASILSGSVTGNLALRDGTIGGGGYTNIHGNAFSGLITANQHIYAPLNLGNMTMCVTRKLSTSLDANYSIPDGFTHTVLAPITATRRVTLPTNKVVGQDIVVHNTNNGSGFNWNFFGSTVKDAAGTTLTSIPDNTIYILTWDGTNWIKIN